jgi:hypothetical protein
MTTRLPSHLRATRVSRSNNSVSLQTSPRRSGPLAPVNSAVQVPCRSQHHIDLFAA